MKYLPVCLTLLLVAGAGCGHRDKPPFTDQRAAQNRWMTQAYGEASVQNAIIRQRTLYPHHFVTEAPRLTELGERDVAVLADHLSEFGGTVNVHRGDAAESLYEQRLQTVQRAFADAGVAPDQIAITDGFPGGEGLPSDRVVEILGTSPVIPSYPASQGLQSGEVRQ